MIVEIIQGLGGILIGLINVYIWVVIIAALLTFVNPDPYNQIVQVLYRLTNPAYRFVKRYIRTDFGGLDLAPLIVIIGLQIIEVIIRSVLHSI